MSGYTAQSYEHCMHACLSCLIYILFSDKAKQWAVQSMTEQCMNIQGKQTHVDVGSDALQVPGRGRQEVWPKAG